MNCSQPQGPIKRKPIEPLSTDDGSGPAPAEVAAINPFGPFDCAQGKTFAANELQAFCGASGVRVMPISGTRQMPSTPNAQRSTPNVSMEPLRFEVLSVGR